MRAPRLVTRALVSSFLTVALVLGAVFGVLSLGVRDQVGSVRQRGCMDPSGVPVSGAPREQHLEQCAQLLGAGGRPRSGAASIAAGSAR